MAAEKKCKPTQRSTRSRAQDRARVAGGQKYEVAYKAKKTGKEPAAVRAPIGKARNSRNKVNNALRGR